MPAFHMLRLGDSLRSYGLRMMQNFIRHFVSVQTIDQLLWYFHNRLLEKVSLSRVISTLSKSRWTPPQSCRGAKELCMGICEVCENEYDKAFEVVVAGKHHTFDSFECAIHALAPVCPHCNCRIVGHGVEADGQIYCCVHCARTAGKTQLKDRV